MKIESVVLDPKFGFEGLYLKGKATEFGFMNADTVTLVKTLPEIYRIVNELHSTITGITEVVRDTKGNVHLILANNVHLYDFPTLYRQEDNSMMNIPNGVEIVEQCVAFDPETKQDKVVGYSVVFDFDPNKQRTRKSSVALAVLSTFFKPKNYLVKQLQNGELVFSGKAGVSLKSLPVIRLDYGQDKKLPHGAGTKAPTEMRNASTTDVRKGDTKATSGFVDFLDVVDVVAKAGAKFVYLPQTNGAYVPLVQTTSKDATEDFQSLGVEVATPRISFSAKTPKVNLMFRKLGTVKVQFNGSNVPVKCVLMRMKSVFNMDDQHMERMMLSCPREKVEWLQNQLLMKTLTFTVSTDKTLNSLVNGALMVGKDDNILLDVDTTNLIPIHPSKFDDMLKYDLPTVMKRLYNAQTVEKWLDAKLAQVAGVIPGATMKPILSEYAGYSNEMLTNMRAYGIDPTTGIYTPEEQSYSKGSGTAVSMEFSLTGWKAPTKTELLNIEAVKASKVAPIITAALNQIDNLSAQLLDIDARDVSGMHKFLTEQKEQANTAVLALTRLIWSYNQAALGRGLYKNYKDGKQYVVNTKSRIKTGEAYMLATDNSLQLKLVGVALAPEQIVG